MTDTETVTVYRADLETMMAYLASGPWTPAEKPDVAGAWKRLTEAKDTELEAPGPPQEPQLPPGEYARVEIMGHDSVTGWVSDGTRAGVPVMIVRDWDGRVMREVPGQALYQFFPLATPLRRPDPLPQLPPDATIALPAADAYEGYYPEADGQGGRRGCDCGPGERCFECATDDEAAAAISPQPTF